MNPIILIACLFLVLFPTSLRAESVYVDIDIDDCVTYTIATGLCGAGALRAYDTVQECLAYVSAGDTCYIRAGTYSEALSLVTTGTAENRITISSYNNEVVTIDGGASRAITPASLAIDYYTITGSATQKLIIKSSTRTPADAGGPDKDAIIYLKGGGTAGTCDTTGGNDGYIVQYVYAEGPIRFYGRDNVAQYNEINGESGKWYSGIVESGGVCRDNTYTHNTIYDVNHRGIWSQKCTYGVEIANNTIRDITGLASASGMGIDIDGANTKCPSAWIHDNTIYNITGGSSDNGQGILLEDAHDAVVEDNYIYNIDGGAEATGINVYSYGNTGCPAACCGYEADDEYRDDCQNIMVRNNVIANISGGSSKAAIAVVVTQCVYIYGNTIYDTNNNDGIFIDGLLGFCSAIPPDFGDFGISDTEVKFNIIHTADYGIHQEGTQTNVTIDRNDYYMCVRGNDVGTNYITSDPKLVSLSPLNGNLQLNSPCIDKGTCPATLIDDYLDVIRPRGASCDMGAYEYFEESGQIDVSIAGPGALTISGTGTGQITVGAP